MFLHDAIIKVLKTKGVAMSTSEIADELNSNNWYIKRDRSLITPFQIHGRTRKYSHLFKRNGELVSLLDNSVNEVDRPKLKPQIAMAKQGSSSLMLEKELLDESRFMSADHIDPHIPYLPGIYCIRIKTPSALPENFAEVLRNEEHNIIYIGKASKSLNRRLLRQELRARGHGTLFRSIGCVLGYTPLKGSLVNKKNKINFKFRQEDEARIISWINENLLVNWVVFKDDILTIESELIQKFKPLLNIQGNPNALNELKALRYACKQIASSVG